MVEELERPETFGRMLMVIVSEVSETGIAFAGMLISVPSERTLL